MNYDYNIEVNKYEKDILVSVTKIFVISFV